jgi:hypothetical protein
MLSGLVKHILNIKQCLLSYVVAHGPPSRENDKDGLELNHFPPLLLDNASRKLLHNQISSLSAEDPLVFNVLIGIEVVKFIVLHLPNVDQCPLMPHMLVRAINLWHQ